MSKTITLTDEQLDILTEILQESNAHNTAPELFDLLKKSEPVVPEYVSCTDLQFIDDLDIPTLNDFITKLTAETWHSQCYYKHRDGTYSFKDAASIGINAMNRVRVLKRLTEVLDKKLDWEGM
jgi:hypothetical protein